MTYSPFYQESVLWFEMGWCIAGDFFEYFAKMIDIGKKRFDDGIQGSR